MIDGGLCSQMHQFMLGQIIKDCGQNVEYDLSFYKRGLDLDGNPTRFFLLHKLFPDICIRQANRIKINLYKHCFFHHGKYPEQEDTSWYNVKAPVYLGGYYSDIKQMIMSGGIFTYIFKLDKNILSPVMKKVCYNIIQTQSVGVHIRRGDLKDYNITYGNPVTLDYIQNSISYFSKELNNPVFYFFSDDKDYIEKEVIHTIGDIKYWVSDRDYQNVYEDFILLSYCKGVITSKGTMGKYAALYGNAKTIVLSADDRQIDIVKYLNCNKKII